MTDSSLARVQQSYLRIAPHADEFTQRFYQKLFELRPDVRALFKRDMDRQRQHFAAAWALIVRNLRILDTLEEPLMQLGAVHLRAGVLPEHYPVACEAMRHALAETIAEAWTPQLARDWRNLLDLICRHMLAGAERAQTCAQDRSHSN